MSEKTNINVSTNIFGWLFCTATAMIGYHIHGSFFWGVMDFLFAPFAWIKWFCYEEVNMTIIKETFSFFLK